MTNICCCFLPRLRSLRLCAQHPSLVQTHTMPTLRAKPKSKVAPHSGILHMLASARTSTTPPPQEKPEPAAAPQNLEAAAPIDEKPEPVAPKDEKPAAHMDEKPDETAEPPLDDTIMENTESTYAQRDEATLWKGDKEFDKSLDNLLEKFGLAGEGLGRTLEADSNNVVDVLEQAFREVAVLNQKEELSTTATTPCRIPLLVQTGLDGQSLPLGAFMSRCAWERWLPCTPTHEGAETCFCCLSHQPKARTDVEFDITRRRAAHRRHRRRMTTTRRSSGRRSRTRTSQCRLAAQRATPLAAGGRVAS